MLKIMLPVGIAACGKSTWAKEEVRKDPEGTARVSRDDLRNMLSNYHFTDTNEKLVTDIRNSAFRFALKRNRNVILDETNLSDKNFPEACKIAAESGKECMVLEKPFFIELDEALERNSKREGTARIPDEAIERMWRKSGGKGHKHYKARVEVVSPQTVQYSALEQDETLQRAVICDLDGTLALVGKRSPYDASNCDIIDSPNKPVIETVKLFYDNNDEIIFCSGREDKYEPETRRFIEKHAIKNYKLFMRKTGDMRKDSIVKQEIYENNIQNKYYVLFVLDDRNQVVEFWRSLGLTCFQVAEGNF
jgi:predicted kinase